MLVSEKTTKNSELLGREARALIEPGASIYQFGEQNLSATGGIDLFKEMIFYCSGSIRTFNTISIYIYIWI